MINAIRYEWRRVKSLRSTWILSTLAILQAGGFAYLITLASRFGQENYNEGFTPAPTKFSDLVYFLFIPFFPVLLSGIAAQAFGHDYRHGTMRISLSLFPRRGQLLWARMTVLTLFQLAVIALAIGLVVLIVELQPDITGGLSSVGLWDSISKLAFYLFLYMWIVVWITVITRIMALGFVLPMVFAIILEPILIGISGFREEWNWVSDVVPFSNFTNWVGSNLSFVEGIQSASTTDTFGGQSPLPLVVLFGITTIWAIVTFHKRDA